jgi:hypothetical protein
MDAQTLTDGRMHDLPEKVLWSMVSATTVVLFVGGDLLDLAAYLVGVALVRLVARRWPWPRPQDALLLHGILAIDCIAQANRVGGYPDGEAIWLACLDLAYLALLAYAAWSALRGRVRLGVGAACVLLLPVVQGPTLALRQGLLHAWHEVPDETTVWYVTKVTGDHVYAVGWLGTCRSPDTCLRGMRFRRAGRTLELESSGALGRFSGTMDDQWPNIHPLLYQIFPPPSVPAAP